MLNDFLPVHIHTSWEPKLTLQWFKLQKQYFLPACTCSEPRLALQWFTDTSFLPLRACSEPRITLPCFKLQKQQELRRRRVEAHQKREDQSGRHRGRLSRTPQRLHSASWLLQGHPEAQGKVLSKTYMVYPNVWTTLCSPKCWATLTLNISQFSQTQLRRLSAFSF